MRIRLLLVVLLFASFCSPAWAADWLAKDGMTATAKEIRGGSENPKHNM